jgi:hypothetical protein
MPFIANKYLHVRVLSRIPSASIIRYFGDAKETRFTHVMCGGSVVRNLWSFRAFKAAKKKA